MFPLGTPEDKRMDIKRLEYFCAIIEKGQIGKAAQSLHISQPPLSMRLRELEEELGVTLIHRRGKAWQITPEGQLLYQKAQFILSYMEGVKNDVSSLSGTLQGLVRIGVCPPCRRMASRVFSGLAHEHPRLRFRVWVMDNQSLERHLQESHLDFALLLLPVKGTNYAIRTLRPLPYYAVFGQGLTAPEKDHIGVEELVGVPLMAQHRRDDEAGVNTVLRRAFQTIGHQPRFALETQDSGFLQSLLLDGFPAVGILNEHEIRSGGLEAFPSVRLDVEGLSLTPAAITLKQAYVSRAAQRIIEKFTEIF